MRIQRQERRSSEELRIGRLLVEMGYIVEDQLKQALQEQMHRERLGVKSTVGEICVENDWCEMRDVAIVMKEQEEEIFRLSSLGQILIYLGFVRPEELDRAQKHIRIFRHLSENRWWNLGTVPRSRSG